MPAEEHSSSERSRQTVMGLQKAHATLRGGRAAVQTALGTLEADHAGAARVLAKPRDSHGALQAEHAATTEHLLVKDARNRSNLQVLDELRRV